MEGTRVLILSAEQVASLLGGPTPKDDRPAPPGWVSPEQYAAHAGFTAKTIRAWCVLAPKEAAWKIGRHWRIDAQAFDRWLRGGGPQAAATMLGRKDGSQGRVH